MFWRLHFVWYSHCESIKAVGDVNNLVTSDTSGISHSIYATDSRFFFFVLNTLPMVSDNVVVCDNFTRSEQISTVSRLWCSCWIIIGVFKRKLNCRMVLHWWSQLTANDSGTDWSAVAVLCVRCTASDHKLLVDMTSYQSNAQSAGVNGLQINIWLMSSRNCKSSNDHCIFQHSNDIVIIAI